MEIGERVLIEDLGHSHFGKEALVIGFAGDKIGVEFRVTKLKKKWLFYKSETKKIEKYNRPASNKIYLTYLVPVYDKRN